MPVFSTRKSQLRASFAFSVLSKLPGLVAVVLILPRLRDALGTIDYGRMLAALALGGLLSLPFNGLGTAARRLLATAHSADDHRAEANVFHSSCLCGLAFALLPMLVIALGNVNGIDAFSGRAVAFVAFYPVLSALLNVLNDNLRAGYNEHFITAGLQFVCQLAVYGFALSRSLFDLNMVVAAAIIQGPFALASCIGLMFLLVQRPYLLIGRYSEVMKLLRGGLFVTAADGSLFAVLNVTTVWLNLSAGAAAAAWFGTLARLFQSVLAPFLLVLLPLVSFISIEWRQMSPHRRRSFNTIFVVGSIISGLIAALAFSGLADFVLSRYYSISSPGGLIERGAVAVFFGVLIAQKIYSMFVYAVEEGGRLSSSTVIIVLMAFIAAIVAGRWMSPMSTMDTFLLCLSLPLVLFVIVDALYRHRQLAIPL